MPDFVFFALLGAAATSSGSLGRRSVMPEQLDVEHQHARRAAAAGVLAVGEVGRDPEAALLADDHQLQALGPALDDVARAGSAPAAPRLTELSNILPSVVQPV